MSDSAKTSSPPQEDYKNKLNPYLVLISGESSTGKSASLENLRNQKKWLYLACEAGKNLPFPHNFKVINVKNPYEVPDAFEAAIAHPDKCDGIIIDSLTFLMNMVERYCNNKEKEEGKSSGWSKWDTYKEFFENLMQDKILRFGKPTIIIAHTQRFEDPSTLITHTYVPIKGGTKTMGGVEACFTNIVSTKVVDTTDLEPYANDLLHINEDEELVGFKYVFQTKKTKTTKYERMRAPKGLFSTKETFIDNDAQLILDRLTNYYNKNNTETKENN